MLIVLLLLVPLAGCAVSCLAARRGEDARDAVYQLSVLLPAFFLPPEGEAERCDPGWRMLLPLAVMAAAVLLVGLRPQPLVDALRAVAGM